MYQGPIKSMLSYWEGLGYHCPATFNPPDWLFLEVLNPGAVRCWQARFEGLVFAGRGSTQVRCGAGRGSTQVRCGAGRGSTQVRCGAGRGSTQVRCGAGRGSTQVRCGAGRGSTQVRRRAALSNCWSRGDGRYTPPSTRVMKILSLPRCFLATSRRCLARPRRAGGSTSASDAKYDFVRGDGKSAEAKAKVSVTHPAPAAARHAKAWRHGLLWRLGPGAPLPHGGGAATGVGGMASPRCVAAGCAAHLQAHEQELQRIRGLITAWEQSEENQQLKLCVGTVGPRGAPKDCCAWGTGREGVPRDLTPASGGDSRS